MASESVRMPSPEYKVARLLQLGYCVCCVKRKVPLVGVAAGDAFGAYVDTRSDSPSFREVVTVPLTVGTQVLVPDGVCNGFQATGDDGCAYVYCFDREWQVGMEGVAVQALDPALGIAWPLAIDPDDPSMLSARDRSLPTFAEVVGER